MNLKTLLDVEIEDLCNQMASMTDKGSKEYTAVEKNLMELTNARLEIEKIESAEAQNDKKIEDDRLARDAQLKENRKDRVSRTVGDIVKTIVPLITSVGMTFMVIYAEAKGVTPFGIGKKWIDKITKY